MLGYFPATIIGGVASGITGINNVKTFGAVGDGVTDDTTAIQTAINFGNVVWFPPGTYICGNITCSKSNLTVIGTGWVVIQGKTGTTGNLWAFSGNGVVVSGFVFTGPIYSAFGDTISLNTLLRFEKNSGNTRISDVRVDSCYFNGAHNACVVLACDRVTATNLDIYRPYEWGLIVGNGCTHILIDGFRAREVGVTEAIKFGFTGQTVLCESVVIRNFLIESCGRLDTDEANWQDGIDLYMAAAQYISISDGIIRKCGNGGIELKKGDSSIVPNVYEEIEISDVLIELDTDHGNGISINWHLTSVDPDTARKIRLSNCTMNYTGGGTADVALGILVQAYTDVEIVDCSLNHFHNGIRFDGTGSSDATVRRPYVNGIRATGCGIGVNFSNGLVEGMTLINSIIGAVSYCVYCEDETGTGAISGNRLTSDTVDAVRCDVGTFEVTDNIISVPSTKRGTKNGGSATIKASGNIRGYDTSTPTIAGALGDEVRNSAPSAGGTEKWLCTTAGDVGSVVWKAASIAA